MQFDLVASFLLAGEGRSTQPCSPCSIQQCASFPTKKCTIFLSRNVHTCQSRNVHLFLSTNVHLHLHGKEKCLLQSHLVKLRHFRRSDGPQVPALWTLLDTVRGGAGVVYYHPSLLRQEILCGQVRLPWFCVYLICTRFCSAFVSFPCMQRQLVRLGLVRLR